MTRIICQMVNILIITLFLFCSSENDIAGNGSEITNGFCVSASGPADSAIVIAYSDKYLVHYHETISPETTFTDMNGNFSIKLGDASWNLLIYDRTRTFGCFVPLQKGDSVLGQIDLDSLGLIRGTINDTNFSAGNLGIPGSPFFSSVNQGVPFIIEKVPTFTYSYLFWKEKAVSIPHGVPPDDDTIIGTIQVKSGSEAYITR